MKDNFFTILRKKIMHAPDRNFDQRFWARFQAEFEPEKKSVLSHFFSRQLLLRFSVTLAVVTVLFVGQRHYFQPTIQDITIGAAFVSQEEMFENLDLLASLEDVDMSDEDWKILIADSGEYEK